MKNFLLSLFFFPVIAFSQIGIGTNTPEATLDVRVADPASPTASAGIAIPQVDVLPSLGNRSGQVVLLTTDNKLYYFNGTSWGLVSSMQDLTTYLTTATASSTYEPLKGADDNFVTDAEKTIIGNTSGTNTGDQDISGIATNASNITALETEQGTQNTAIALNTAKTGITPAQATIISNTSGTNTGDQDISGIATNTSDIAALETEQGTQNTAIALNTAKTGITPAQATIISNTSGTNTGDQDISGIATNASDITALETEQGTQNTAIALNTAKTGITPAQATIISNTSGTNTGDQDISGIATNTSDITALETEQGAQNTAIALNTAKTGITPAQATIISNTSGTNTGDQDISGVATNTSDITALETEQGIQNTAIALNTAKITNATHSGDVTGDVALTIADDAVTNVKIADNSVDGTNIALGSDVAGNMMYYNGTDWVKLATGTVGQMLVINSLGDAPEWITVTNNSYLLVANDAALNALTTQLVDGLIVGVTASESAGSVYAEYRVISTSTDWATSTTQRIFPESAPLFWVGVDNYLPPPVYHNGALDQLVWETAAESFSNGDWILSPTKDNIVYTGSTTNVDITWIPRLQCTNSTGSTYNATVRLYLNGAVIGSQTGTGLTANSDVHVLPIIESLNTEISNGDIIKIECEIFGGWTTSVGWVQFNISASN